MSNNNKEITLDDSIKLIDEMLFHGDKLKQGFDILSQFQQMKMFHFNMLKVCVNDSDGQRGKLASSVSKVFIKNNWDTINNEEKEQIIELLIDNVKIFYGKDKNYFMKNFIAKIIGIIGAKEIQSQQFNLIQTFLSEIKNENNKGNDINDMLLRILMFFLQESDDRAAIIAYDVIDAVLFIFGKVNAKNKEKILQIIEMMMNKISYTDGTDDEFLVAQLDKNELYSKMISLFIDVLNVNEKFTQLCDIKKHILKIFQIFISDLPYYSKSHKIKESIITDVVNLFYRGVNVYLSNLICNIPIQYTQEEQHQISNGEFEYKKGYESDTDEESGFHGMIIEALILLNDIADYSDNELVGKLILCGKMYSIVSECLIEDESENEEVEDIINIRTLSQIFTKTLISKSKNDEILLQYVKSLFNELINGINYDIYSSIEIKKEVLGHSSISNFIYETDLYIIGALSNNIYDLYEKGKIILSDIEVIIKALLNLLSSNASKMLTGRAIWTLCKLSMFYKNKNETSQLVPMSIINTVIQSKSALVRNFGYISLYEVQVSGITLDEKVIRSMYEHILHEDILDENNESYILKGLVTIAKLELIRDIASNYIGRIINDILLKTNCYHQSSLFLLFKEYISTLVINGNMKVTNMLLYSFLSICISIANSFILTNKISNLKNTHSFDLSKVNGDAIFSIIEIINLILEYSKCSFENENISLLETIITSFINFTIETNNKIYSFYHLLSLLIFLFIIKIGKRNEIIGQYIHYLLTRKDQIESALMYLPNVIVFYYLNNESKITKNLLISMISIINENRSPLISNGLLVIILRLIVLFKDDIVNILQSENYLSMILTKIIHYKIKTDYDTCLTLKALTTLFDMRNSNIENLIFGISSQVIILKKVINRLNPSNEIELFSELEEDINHSYNSSKFQFLNIRNDSSLGGYFEDYYNGEIEDEINIDSYYQNISQDKIENSNEYIKNWLKNKLTNEKEKEYLIECANCLSIKDREIIEKNVL